MSRALRGFSGFGFPKSHAAAFALLAYQSAWLRHRYPAEFLCALLNAQPMGFYPPASLVRDAQRRGVEVRPPDVRVSGAKCRLEGGAVRVGLGYVRGLGEEPARALAAERERRGPFTGIRDLAQRAPVDRPALEALVAGVEGLGAGEEDDLRARREHVAVLTEDHIELAVVERQTLDVAFMEVDRHLRDARILARPLEQLGCEIEPRYACSSPRRSAAER